MMNHSNPHIWLNTVIHVTEKIYDLILKEYNMKWEAQWSFSRNGMAFNSVCKQWDREHLELSEI